ncbi:MAG: glycosyltransferase [Bryobacterales bacterium]|nr:glycosyltransferase [Bryobacterales bacterium]
MPPAEGFDVLFLPMVDWHARMQRAQQLANALAGRGHRCFYLSPHLGREFSYPVRLGKRTRICALGERVWELHTGLGSEPVFHHRLLTSRESASVAESVLNALTAFGSSKLLMISQFPVWTEAAEIIRTNIPSVLVYDCHDLLSGFRRISPEIISAEKQLFQRADFSVFTARSLVEQLRTEYPVLGESSIVIRNGVDVRHFQPVPGGKSKVAGYVGSLDDWFDVQAVRQAAMDHPSVQFVFLGRIESPRVRDLESLPNVRFYGEVPYHRLPEYMAEFDVALIPFLITPLTLATNPIKLYEYFSCGIPVVSTALPEVQNFGDLVYTAATPSDYSAQVGRALAEHSPERREARRSVAIRESWHARSGQLLDAVNTYMQRR